MKTKFFSLLSIAILIVCFVLGIYCSFFTLDTANAQTDYASTQAYSLLKSFIQNSPNRGSDSIGEQSARIWLKQKLLDFGFSEGQISEQLIANTNQSYNLIAKIDTPNAQNQIIIGAHYDSTSDSEGAVDNATGVVALLQIAQKLLLQKNSLPFNISIVFFGSEEIGLFGSYHFVEQMTATDLSNTSLMINLDCVAGGDFLYIMSEEVVTDFQRIFVAGGAGLPVQIKNKPLGMGIYTDYDVWGYGYFQLIQGSDHTPFRLAEIPVVTYFSGNFSLFNGFIESTDKQFQVINTAYDTLANLEKRGMLAVNQIDTVVGSVCNTISNSGNKQTILDAKNQLISRVWFNSMIVYIAAAVIIGALAAFAITYHKKLVKQSLLGVAEVKNQSVFSSPNSDEVFTYDPTFDQSKSSDKNNKTDKPTDDVEDIFKF